MNADVTLVTLPAEQARLPIGPKMASCMPGKLCSSRLPALSDPSTTAGAAGAIVEPG